MQIPYYTILLFVCVSLSLSLSLCVCVCVCFLFFQRVRYVLCNMIDTNNFCVKHEPHEHALRFPFFKHKCTLVSDRAVGKFRDLETRE